MPTVWMKPTDESLKLFEARKEDFKDLYRRIDASQDFTFDDWEILFHTLEHYHPDYVLEVGRGAGNSTCVLLDYCLRYSGVEFCSVDLYDNWGMHTREVLPQEFIEKIKNRTMLHQNFLDFDIKKIIGAAWERLFLFWDVNDTEATTRLATQFLPHLTNRNALGIVHDVGFRTGRPKRYIWGEFESLYPDLEIIGNFLDRAGWPAGVPNTENIFGHYRNAGHMLVFENKKSDYEKR